LQPNYFEAHNNLGIAFINQGRIDEAIGQFQEVVRLNPDYVSGRENLARALTMKNAPASR
jgi:tetratricopeptide (TPR) repeat protein